MLLMGAVKIYAQKCLCTLAVIFHKKFALSVSPYIEKMLIYDTIIMRM